MITVFIDDSGTDSNQKVAIASGLIVESRRIKSLDDEFVALGREEGFSYFHTSECVAGDKQSGCAGWDYEKKKRVCSSVRHIAMKYGVKACSIAIDTRLYDEVVPPQLRKEGGDFHYTWAVGYLIEMLDHWAARQRLDMPFEYLFDSMGKNQKKNLRREEIKAVMEKAEQRRPGYYLSHYEFKRSKDTPGLQCADILAWSCYQFALSKLAAIRLKEIAGDSFTEFDGYRPTGAKWLLAIVQTPEQLQRWVADKTSPEVKRSLIAAI